MASNDSVSIHNANAASQRSIRRRELIEVLVREMNSFALDLLYPAKIKRQEYCCALRCFRQPRTVVDGMSCDKCRHYSYCLCECFTFKMRHYGAADNDILILLFTELTTCALETKEILLNGDPTDRELIMKLVLQQVTATGERILKVSKNYSAGDELIDVTNDKVKRADHD